MGNKSSKPKPTPISSKEQIAVPLERKIDGDNCWVLIFRQSYGANSVHNIFWPKNETKLNENIPSAPNYSILHTLEQFRNPKDGKFEFKLIWPNTNIKCQHWKQASNPTDCNSSGNVIGYQAININHTDNAWNGIEWTGNHSHTKGNDCLINGSTNSDFLWFYTIGSYRDWNQGIPGPNTMVNVTELWVLDHSFNSNEVAMRMQKEINYDKLQIKIEQNKEWILVFRQSYGANSVHNRFWPKNETKLNENDSSAPNYAILHMLEEFRDRKDGKFEFKLIWPNSNIKCQHWKQASNPTDKNSSGHMIGYEAININHTHNAWGGLEWTGNHSHTKGNDCLINGSTNSDFLWFYTIGSYRDWNQGIPGPNTMVNVTELWILNNSFDIRGEAFMRYFLQNLGIPMSDCCGWLAKQMDKYIYDILVCGSYMDKLVKQNIIYLN